MLLKKELPALDIQALAALFA